MPSMRTRTRRCSGGQWWGRSTTRSDISLRTAAPTRSRWRKASAGFSRPSPTSGDRRRRELIFIGLVADKMLEVVVLHDRDRSGTHPRCRHGYERPSACAGNAVEVLVRIKPRLRAIAMDHELLGRGNVLEVVSIPGSDLIRTRPTDAMGPNQVEGLHALGEVGIVGR